MSNLLVSIVINNYNYSKYIREAIESAVNQTYPRTEVIVVDDGSTDESRRIISEYDAAGKILAIFKENGGQASAVNAGFAQSRGDVVIFLDSDDILEPFAAERVAAGWNPGVSKVHFPLRQIDEGGATGGVLVPTQPLPQGDLLDVVLKSKTYTSPPMSGNAWSRELLSAVMPIPESEWRLNADRYLITLAPLYGTVVALEEPCGRYRVHGLNASFVTNKADPAGVFRVHLFSDISAYFALLDHARRRGFEVQPDDRLHIASALHYRTRMLSLVLDPARHPLRQDSRFRIGIWGARTSFFEPGMPPVSKLKYVLFFLFAGLFPAGVTRRLLRQLNI